MEIVQLNYLAVLVSGLVYFSLGGLWYSPALFARPWLAAIGKTEEEIRQGGSPVAGYAVSLIGALLSAFVLALLVHHTGTTTLQGALTLGFFVWLGFIATTNAPPYFFEDRSRVLYAIYVGYTLAGFLIMSVILTFWR